jgi:hypothetical protein
MEDRGILYHAETVKDTIQHQGRAERKEGRKQSREDRSNRQSDRIVLAGAFLMLYLTRILASPNSGTKDKLYCQTCSKLQV